MKVLVVGGGGREHAVIKKLSESKLVSSIICAPGNGGISALAKCFDVGATDIDGMVKLAKSEKVDFVVVTPDDPLALGMVDALEAEGIKAFGPNKAAAQLEASKVFAKNVMESANVPTAKAKVFSDPTEARAYINEVGVPIVIKADGLAKGKGVIVAETIDDAIAAVDDMLSGNAFGSAGSTIVVEEFLVGSEMSVMCFCDGTTVKPLTVSSDHKRAFDGDKGPNTGGMGVIAPCPLCTDEVKTDIINKAVVPVIRYMKESGHPFRGILYAGIMLTKNGPYVLEYNARFGDPETQAVLPLLDSDLCEIMLACIDGTLDKVDVNNKDAACAVVIMASGGYPGKYKNGVEIHGLFDDTAESFIIHAGTKRIDDTYYTNGGRVLGVCAIGKTLDIAVKNAYTNVLKVSFEGAFYRKDIGGKYVGNC